MPDCRWQDDYPDSWEPEESISADIVALWEGQQIPETEHAHQMNGSNSAGTRAKPEQTRQLTSVSA